MRSRTLHPLQWTYSLQNLFTRLWSRLRLLFDGIQYAQRKTMTDSFKPSLTLYYWSMTLPMIEGEAIPKLYAVENYKAKSQYYFPNPPATERRQISKISHSIYNMWILELKCQFVILGYGRAKGQFLLSLVITNGEWIHYSHSGVFPEGTSSPEWPWGETTDSAWDVIPGIPIRACTDFQVSGEDCSFWWRLTKAGRGGEPATEIEYVKYLSYLPISVLCYFSTQLPFWSLARPSLPGLC